MDDIQKDAWARIDGSFYKLGLHDHPYIWVGDKWVKSNRNKRELIIAINNKVARERNKKGDRFDFY